MKNAVKLLTAGSAIAMAMTASAFAADIYEPQVIETPVYEVPESLPASVSGWYIRGDVGYSWNKYRGAIYGTSGGTNRLFGDIDESFFVGGGVGYQINHYLRTDLTLDYDFESDFKGYTRGTCGAPAEACTSTDTSSFAALTVMANAYIDLGTYAGFTPYVGAGIGGSHVKWGSLRNEACQDDGGGCDTPVTHGGYAKWRFAYALMAGFSYDVSHKLALDFGYRYRKIEGGGQFKFASGTGPGYDYGMESHQVRAGLRYKFGGSSYQEPIPAVYQPEPVYK